MSTVPQLLKDHYRRPRVNTDDAWMLYGVLGQQLDQPRFPRCFLLVIGAALGGIHRNTIDSDEVYRHWRLFGESTDDDLRARIKLPKLIQEPLTASAAFAFVIAANQRSSLF